MNAESTYALRMEHRHKHRLLRAGSCHLDAKPVLLRCPVCICMRPDGEGRGICSICSCAIPDHVEILQLCGVDEVEPHYSSRAFEGWLQSRLALTASPPTTHFDGEGDGVIESDSAQDGDAVRADRGVRH